MTGAAEDPVRAAAALFRQGRSLEARGLLEPVLAEDGTDGDAHQLLGLVLHSLGDLDGAERALRRAAALKPGDEIAAHALARLLQSQDRDEEALAVFEPVALANPSSGPAQYALSGLLYAAGREAEAEAAALRAVACGFDRPDAWLFIGRLRNIQGRLAEAEDAYRAAVARDPLSAEAQRDLAQLIWMRTGDVRQARAQLDAAPPTPGLTAVAVKLLQDAGEAEAAYRLAAERADRDPALQVLAARAAVRVDPEAGERRLGLAPPWSNPLALGKARMEIALALGRPAAAAEVGEALAREHPRDHFLTALLAAAWRQTGDPRYRQLHDYGRLVRTYRIAPPDGWPTVEAYLKALEAALDQAHLDLTHPMGQSLRHGSQTQRSLLDYPDPAIRAFFQAIDGPVRRHMASLGEEGGYEVAGAWSVRLGRQGYHEDHVHPAGWLSSAFYVRTPHGQGREGWLKFGQPGTPTAPPLEPEHWIRPEPGMLVLFPSYMWHGTAPFSSDETRLTCAFDLVRADA